MKPRAKAKAKPAKGPVHVERVGAVGVRIYSRRTKGYPAWEVADYSSGRRVLRSFADFDKAKAEAERIALAISRGEAEAAALRGPERASYGRAIELLRETGMPPEVAAAQFAEACKILGNGALVSEAAKFYVRHNPTNRTDKTVSEVVEELLKVRAKGTKRGRPASPRYLEDLRSRLSKFADSFQVPISNVVGGDVQLWLDGLDLAPQGKKNFRTVISTLFAFAQSRGYIGLNPCDTLEKIATDGGDIDYWRPEEMLRLLTAASPEFLPCLALGGFAGLRSSEIERLPFEAIDLKRGIITLDRNITKTKRRRTVPIADNLAEWLAPYAGRRGPVWSRSHDEFYDAQSETLVKANAQKDARGTPLPHLKWRENGLRHAYATYRLAQTGNLGLVATELGNTRDVAMQHYTDLAGPDDGKAWFAVSPKRPANVTPMRRKAVRHA